MGEWDRARLAYRDLLGDADPAAGVLVGNDVVDLRPEGLGERRLDPVTVVSGPGDLLELRTVVESITGVGTWPAPPPVDGAVLRASIVLDRPVPAVRLVAALEGLIIDRGAMWRTWRTTMELVAARLAEVPRLSVEAVVVSR